MSKDESMRYEAKVMNNGQVTIPKEIRDVLGVAESGSVIFEADATGVHLRPLRPTSAFAHYAGIWRDGEGLTVDEIHARLHDARGHDEQ